MQRSGFLRYQIFISVLALFSLVLSSFGHVNAEDNLLPDPPLDQVVVKLKPGTAIGTILTRYQATLLGTIAESNLHFLKLSSGQTAEQLLPSLNIDPDLYYAEPNYYADGEPNGGAILFRAHTAPVAGAILFRAHGDLTPMPSGMSAQWAWEKIKLADARKISTGQGVIVAVLDTGLAPDHPLLSSSLTAGYDFVRMTDGIYDQGNNFDDDGNGVVDEFVGHGTHVSGIIITEAPGVQIMPIRVLNSEGMGTYWEVAAGIKYAVDHGADIINMSLSAPRLTPSLKDALDYASSHGVIIVSAAGTGTGPNYPAAYSNPTLLGVGSTDISDAIAWFSGGQLSDTDVYAPGTDIYSAYPYNGYALASGTSMSSPIVAGEAALLLSRYPDWTSAKVIQQILSKTSPVTGSSIGRVNLSNALTTGLEIAYSIGDPGSPNDNHIKPRIRLINNTPEDIALNELKVRYWYTRDSDQLQTFNCDHATINCGNILGSFVHFPGNQSASDTYLELGFPSGAGYLAGGSVLEMYLRLNQANWSNYVEANDYSYDAAKTVPTRWDHITIYRNGTLIWGIEPSNNQSVTNTSTVLFTPTKTQTPIPTIYSSTSTRTATAPATLTRTATSLPPTTTVTRSATPPPSATVTRTATLPPSTPTTAGGTLKIQYMPGNITPNFPAISPKFILVNGGTSGVPFSELKLRYWFTVDGNQPQSFWCDYASFGCSNLSVQFVPLQSPRPGADYYLEVGFSSGAGSLGAGANSGQVQTRFSKNDWSSYVQTDDYSFDPSKTQFSDWNRVTLYRNGTLIWGIEP